MLSPQQNIAATLTSSFGASSTDTNNSHNNTHAKNSKGGIVNDFNRTRRYLLVEEVTVTP